MNANTIGLGTGIFLTPDISLILGIKSQKVNNWLNNYWTEKIHYFEKSKTVNFLTMIEVYVFNTLLEKGISRKKIKKFHKELARKFNNQFPFANKTLYYSKSDIYTDEQKDVYFDSTMNYIINDFIIPFADKIDFSEQTNRAVRFYPQGKDSSIVVDPNIQFGRPIIKGTRITIDVIQDLLKKETEHEEIAFMYDIDEKSISEIIDFYKTT